MKATRLDEPDTKTDSLQMQHTTFSRNTRNQLMHVFQPWREV